MKFLTTNFVRCSVKSCGGTDISYPLKFEECEIEIQEQDFDPLFIISMLNRLNWDALLSIAHDLGNDNLPPSKPTLTSLIQEDNQIIDELSVNSTDDLSKEDLLLLKDLHNLLLETQIIQGKMICKNCNHIYYIKDSIANFLLPPHLAN